MRTDPTPPKVKREDKAATELKRRAAIVIAFISVFVLFLKILLF